MRLPRRAILIATLMLAATLPAAADAQSWTFNVEGDTAYLIYGTPESDDTLIAFSCKPKRGTWHITAFLDSKGIKPGRPATLTLKSGARSVTLAGKGQNDEMNGTTDVAVQGKIDPAALAVLTEAAPLVVSVPGDAATIDPETKGDKAARFAAACGKK
jgi:hypothetical protein